MNIKYKDLIHVLLPFIAQWVDSATRQGICLIIRLIQRQNGNVSWRRGAQIKQLARPTPRQNVYACAGLTISGLFFIHTFQSDHRWPKRNMVRLLGRINTFLKGSSTWGFLQYSSMHNLIILKKKERINSLLNELNWREVYSTKKVW